MSTRFYVIDRIVYNDKIMNYCNGADNPIADNIGDYYNENTDLYYLNEDDFKEFKETVEKDLKYMKNLPDVAYYRKILKNMEKRINLNGEIEISCW